MPGRKYVWYLPREYVTYNCVPIRQEMISRKDHAISVACRPYLMNSARLHKVFQNFVVPWKIHIYKNLILSSDASRQDASNGVRVAYVNFDHKWVL